MPLNSDYGLSAGLNFRTNAGEAVNNEINDLKYSIQQKKENEAMAIAKQKLFNEDLEFQNGSNPYDSEIIKNENQQLISSLGKYVTENPDWATNVYKAGEVKRLKQSMKSTPAVLRSVAYKDSVAEYNKYLQEALKTPNKYNLDQLDAFKRKIDNYTQFGNSDGVEAAKQQGAKPLVFTPPEEIENFEEIHRKSGDAMNPDEFNALRNGRDGAYTGRVSEAKLKAKAEELYSQKRSQYDYIYKDKPDKVRAIMDAIDPYTKREYKIGERNSLADAMALEKFKASLKTPTQPGASAYDISILNTDRTVPGSEYLDKTFTSTVPNFYRTADGKIVQNKNDAFHFDGDIAEEGYGKKGYRRTGVKEAPGYFIKSLDWGKGEGGYLYDPWGTSGIGNTDYEVRPEFRDFVEIIETPPGKDGKTQQVLKVKSVAKINANNPMYRNAFDANVAKLTTKQRDAEGVIESSLESNERPKTVIQNGYTYTLNPTTGEYE